MHGYISVLEVVVWLWWPLKKNPEISYLGNKKLFQCSICYVSDVRLRARRLKFMRRTSFLGRCQMKFIHEENKFFFFSRSVCGCISVTMFTCWKHFPDVMQCSASRQGGKTLVHISGHQRTQKSRHLLEMPEAFQPRPHSKNTSYSSYYYYFNTKKFLNRFLYQC